MPGGRSGPYRADRLEPVVPIGGRVMLLDSNGPLTGESLTGWYEVAFAEPVFGIGPKGAVLLWSQSTTTPTSLGPLPAGSASGTIPRGSSRTSSPAVFNMGRHQLLQFRWLPRPCGTGLTPFVAQDIDFQFALPGGLARGRTLTAQSRWNMRFQMPYAGDLAAIPAQGTNSTVARTTATPFECAPQTETFLFEQAYQPEWTIINNGSTDLDASNQIQAIVLDVQGYRLDLLPIQQPEPGWKLKWLNGKQGYHPADNYAIVPITGRGVAAVTQGA